MFGKICTIKAHNQVKWKFLAHFFTPNFFCIKWKILTRIVIPKNILQFLCAVLEKIQFEVSAISLYGNRTTMYGIWWKLWSLLSLKLDKEFPWNFRSSCNLPRSLGFWYKILRLLNWEFPDYVALKKHDWVPSTKKKSCKEKVVQVGLKVVWL